ncbi:hypothetical protein [Cupriavidus sp. P-10]|uniref:hypothetical protein n=1 Tax=Cupriavidus sp. P-10 TaxID=2027911 RepID=UPI00232C871D|nr:hypothetical protein [Cupriavidus sp. P-10]
MHAKKGRLSETGGLVLGLTRDGADGADGEDRAARSGYFAVGMANSAPFAMLSGQRCITDFWRV